LGDRIVVRIVAAAECPLLLIDYIDEKEWAVN
jgi:hypothetical protein